jgi:glyoxylase-like metal-dependent hydrolase (beta-lactamase superfamily II)
MQLLELQQNIWVIQGGANIGVIAHEGHCLIIDSGMDKDSGQNILKQVKKLGLTPTALLITHAHADHFGAAHNLVRQTGLQVNATRVEASVISGPILEPLYLFGGALPPGELQHAPYNTTVQAALSALDTQDVIHPIFQDNRLL